jgi:hypothetical protein
MKKKKNFNIGINLHVMEVTSIVFYHACTDLILNGKAPRISMKYCNEQIKSEIMLRGISALDDKGYYMDSVLDEKSEDSAEHLIYQKICKQITKIYSK